MKKSYSAALVTLMMLSTAAWAGQAKMNLAADFGALPKVRELTLSPSGHVVAWMQPRGRGSGVFIFNVGAKAVRREVQLSPALTVYWLGWESDNTLLMRAVTTEPAPPQSELRWHQPIRLNIVLALNIASGKIRTLLSDRMVGGNYFTTGVQLLDWDIPKRPHTVIMSVRMFNPTAYRSTLGTMIHSEVGDSGMVDSLFAVDTRTGKSTAISSGDAYTDGWFIDNAGNPVARSEWHANRFTIEARQGHTWRPIYHHGAGQAPDFGAQLDPTAHAILAFAPGGSGLWKIPLDGSPPQELLSAAKHRVTQFDLSRYSKTLIYAWVGRSDPHRLWFDPSAKSRYESIAHVFPGRRVEVYDHSRNGQEVLAEVDDPQDAPTYYLINFAAHSAVIAGAAYPQLAHVELAQVHAVRYPTHDGQTVKAEVYVPPGGGKDLPLVVLVPGGAVGNDPRNFDWFAQFLAAEGDVVLQPEVSGTALATEGGYLLWGGVSQRYAIAGVHLLVKQGLVDPHRVCIAGMGYGGYAALAGVAFSPGTYACAVSVNGISDLGALVAHMIHVFGGSDSTHAALVAWRNGIGSPVDPKVAQESPIHAVGAMQAPVLLIGTQDDTVVPESQSAAMAHALKAQGKAVTFLKLARGGNSLARSDDRIKALTAIGTFLNRYLHPTG